MIFVVVRATLYKTKSARFFVVVEMSISNSRFRIQLNNLVKSSGFKWSYLSRVKNAFQIRTSSRWLKFSRLDNRFNKEPKARFFSKKISSLVSGRKGSWFNF